MVNSPFFPTAADEQQANLNAQAQIGDLRRAVRTGGAGLQYLADQPIFEPTPTAVVAPAISQQARNTDGNFSLNAWFEAVAGAGNSAHECAYIFTHAKDSTVLVYDGEMLIGSDHLKCLTSAPFVVGDVGKNIIVDDGGSGTILTYVGHDEVIVSFTAPAGISNSAVRFRMEKMTHKTAISDSLATVTSILKNDTHANFLTNIQDPKWDKGNGEFLLGSTNTLGMFFGTFNTAGTSWTPIHSLYPQMPVFVSFKIIKANQYVKPKGRIYVSIYNNSTAGLGVLRGGNFALDGQRAGTGTPTTTVSVTYMLIARTDQGYTIFSRKRTIANSAPAASLNAEIYNLLGWDSFAGVLAYTWLRKVGAGNVERAVEDIPGGLSRFSDNGEIAWTDTGSASFPAPTSEQLGVRSYWASSPGELEAVGVEGIAASWTDFRVWVPVSQINLGEVEDPAVLIGLTDSAGIEVLDAVTAGVANVTSAAGIFTAAMGGKPFNLTDPASGQDLSGTTAYVNANTMALTPAPGWTSTGNILEIEDCFPYAFKLDKIGVSPREGDWVPHVEDMNGRPQTIVSTPDGSTQGGSGNGGTGGINCVLDEMPVTVKSRGGFNVKIRADLLQPGMLAFFGQRDKNGQYRYNRVTWVRIWPVTEVIRAVIDNRALFGTHTHRVISEKLNYRIGIPLSHRSKGEKLIRYDEETEKYLEREILDRTTLTGEFNVVSFGLESCDGDPITAHLCLINDILGHNRKNEDQ